MSEPVRRGRGAAGSIVATVMSVLTLPFRGAGPTVRPEPWSASLIAAREGLGTDIPVG